MTVLSDDRFRREGDNLFMDYSISLLHALTGFSHKVTQHHRQGCRLNKPMQVKHLDGHEFVLSSENITRPGQVVEIEGEGMPRFEKVRTAAIGMLFWRKINCSVQNGERGRLFVTFGIDFPSQLTASQQTEIKRILTGHE